MLRGSDAADSCRTERCRSPLAGSEHGKRESFMNKEDILKALERDGDMSEEQLSKLAPISANRLHRLLYELVFDGLVSFDGEKYRNITKDPLCLGKVVTKKHSFVYLKLLREPCKVDVRLTGREADQMIVGDLAYLHVDFDRFGPRAARFVCPLQYVQKIKGNYAMDSDGKPEVGIAYLQNAGVRVEVVENRVEGLNIGDYIEATILERGENHLRVRIDRLLVKAGDVGSDISQIIASQDAPMAFPEEVIYEAQAIPQELRPEDYEGRKDLREENIVTVDGDDSRDFDDAVSAVRTDFGWTIGIHIADVAHYVRPGHPLDAEARNRGTSIYVADRVVPMLPVELSNGICSLNPNVDRLAITCRAHMDRRGNVFKAEVYPSVIRSHGRLTYNQVNEYYATGKSESLNPETQELLTILKECADVFRAKREKQGAMKLESTELHFKLDETGFPIAVEIKEQGAAEKMIEDMMIVANIEVAKLLHKLDIPTLYRVHENPPEEKLSNLVEYVKKMNLMSRFPIKADINAKNLSAFLASIEDEHVRKAMGIVMLRSMAKARYTPDELGHFGLAEPEYLHFTSPIRRYPDTLVHRALHEYVFQKKPFDKQALYDQLKSLGDDLSADEKRAQVIERSVDDLETAKYLSVRIGEKFHGHISGFLDFGMFVELDNGLEGLMPFEYMSRDRYFYDDKRMMVKNTTPGHEHDYELGDDIDICVLSANIPARKVTFCSLEMMEELGINLTPEDFEALKRNDLSVFTRSQYLADRHLEYHQTHRRPSRVGARQGGFGDRRDDRRDDRHNSRDDRHGNFRRGGGDNRSRDGHSRRDGFRHNDRRNQFDDRRKPSYQQETRFDYRDQVDTGKGGDDPAVGD